MNTRKVYRCRKCGYKWIGRKGTRPGNCPNPHCRTSLWDRRR